MDKLKSPILLDLHHVVENFDCGAEPLNNYLKNFALSNNLNGSARTYVTTKAAKIAGYYTLTPGSVAKATTPQHIGKGLANHPVPVIIIARLAVDKTEQGHGIGKALVRDALLRIVDAAEIIGGRAVLVHAKDTEAKSFYEQLGFDPSPTDTLHLYLLIKDIKKTLGL
ncbi:MAG: GNAT family N-acetyltransferase [Candidatus Omnitrophica bacterium]|nr:GNAT family N-acetyltransferase [Candidatus Omnitrophota bacterium]